MANLKLPAIRLTQDGVKLYVTRMYAKDVVKFGKVDAWVPGASDSKQGYQREPRASRLRRVAKFILGKLYPVNILPTAILMNSRDGVSFHEEIDDLGFVTIRPDDELWIVDGQHRIGGLKHAIEEMGAAELEDFPLPVVITEKLDKYAEMMQFFIVNTEQKKIRTDLANRLLQQQAKKTDGFASLLEQGVEWKVRATAVTDRLNVAATSIWKGKIQAPNQKKTSNHVVKEISFTTSLRPVVAGTSLLSKLHVDQVSELLGRYWQALADLMPEAFKNPDRYVIQKTPGIFSLHSIFPLVFELARQRSKNVDVDSFIEVLRPMLDTDDGAEYWERDNDDGASQYGSMKGFRILANHLESSLPKVEVNL
jgi:DGQHR domain-containing protein